MENSFLRNHSHEESQGDAFEYAPSSEEDISVQLREKIRSQALRLRALEKYRKLCEDRISQLDPSHPFPLTPDHLKMQPNTSAHNLHLSKHKISRLEQQISQSQISSEKPNHNGNEISKLNQQIYELSKDKTLLEESLRAEMLASEEQRTYIEVLRQALESKMEDLGLSNFTPEEFSDYSQARTQIGKIRIEAAKYQNTILDQESHLKRISQEYKEMEIDCKRLILERKEIDQQLEDAAEALQIGEDEVKKLEEEKSALLDYADEKAKTEQELLNEIEGISDKYQNLKNMHEKTLKELKEQKNRGNEIEQEIEHISQEAARSDKSIKEIQQSYENARVRIEEKDSQIKKLREEMRVLNAKNESFQANNSTLSETLKETQNELDNVQNELEDYKEKAEKLQNNCENVSNQIKALKTEKEKNENKLNHIEKDFAKQKEVSSQNNEENSNQIRSLQNDLQNISLIKQELSQKDKINTQKISDLSAQLNHLQEEIELLYTQNTELGEENGIQREEIGIANMKMIQFNNEKEILHSELMRLENTCNMNKNIQDENYSLKNKIEELNRALNVANENFRDKQMRCQNYEYELQKLSQNLKISQEEAEKERFAKLMANEDLKHKTQKIDELDRELQNLYIEIDNCLRFISPKKFENSSNLYTIQQFLQNSDEEIKLLTRKLYSTTQDLEIATRRLTDISSENLSKQSKEASLLSQADNLYKENSYIKNNLSSLQNEIKSLHDMIQNIQQENSGLREQAKLANYETTQLRHGLENSGITTRTLEDKVNLLNSEKAQLQSLIVRIQRTLGTNELQRIYFEIMRVRGDLEISEREKLRLEGQLLRMEKEENANIMQKETLKAKIKSCETQIYSFKRKISNLEEELNAEEGGLKNKGEERSFDSIRTVKKTLIYPDSGRSTPSRFSRNDTSASKSPYQPRFCDSPDRFRTSFQH